MMAKRDLFKELEKLLNAAAEEEGLNTYSIEIDEGSLKGDGYVGLITAVEIYDARKNVKLIVKGASNEKALRKAAHIVDLFHREVYMYNTVIPTLQVFELKHGVLPMSSFPKYYCASLVKNSEAIVLEDMRAKGFMLWKRQNPMDEEHVSLVLKEFGHFHALSFALADQDPAAFSKLKEAIGCDIYAKFYQNGKGLYKDLCNKALNSLCPIEDAEAYNSFKDFSGYAAQFVIDLPKLVDKYSAILHGDGWTTNIMFGYDDTNNISKPTRLCFIDFAFSRIGPPVLDISYFFYICSSKDIITNFRVYLDIYYDALAANLRKLNSDPDKLYPYSVFCQQWKESARFGLLISLLVYQMMLAKEEEVPDLLEATKSGKDIADGFIFNISETEEYYDRVKHLILHFVKNKFL